MHNQLNRGFHIANVSTGAVFQAHTDKRTILLNVFIERFLCESNTTLRYNDLIVHIENQNSIYGQ